MVEKEVSSFFSLAGSFCFWMHMLFAGFIILILIAAGSATLANKKKYTESSEASVISIRDVYDGSITTYKAVVVFKTKDDRQITVGDLRLDTPVPVNSEIVVYYDPSDPTQIITENPKYGRILIVIGVVILVVHVLWGLALYYSPVLRQVYGGWCVLGVFINLFR